MRRSVRGLRRPRAPDSTPGAGGFGPIQLLEVELAGHAGPLVQRLGAGGGRQTARALVRLHGAPLGAVDLELPASGIEASAVAELGRRAFGPALHQHLRSDGHGGTATAPRCIRERNAFRLRAPFASIVVATRARPESLASTLGDLIAQDYPRFEIIVVDNAPINDATRTLVEHCRADATHVRYVCEPVLGLAVAHNRGLAEVGGELVAFTDDDVRVDRRWLLELARAFELADHIACVTGLILPAELETPAQVWIEDWVGLNKGYEPKLFDMHSNRPASRLFPYAAGIFGSGANMAFRTETLRALGGFDPATGAGTRARGGDDLAAFFSVVSAGYTLAYQPAAIVYHSHRRDLEGLRSQMYGYGAGLTAFLTKIVLERPRLLLDIAWRVPFGAAHAVGSRPGRRERRARRLPRGLALSERRGMIAGPLGYLIERRRRRALYLHPVPLSNAQLQRERA